jgi:RNA polymerase II subunit A small phosphatase-like protein
MAKHWEVVIFTASLSKYADPLLDMLDTDNVIAARLFREHCVLHGGNYVKDLTKLGRKLKNQVIIDNAPKSYLFQPHNAIPITSWFDDMHDTELLDCIPVLSKNLIETEDVRDVLEKHNSTFEGLCAIAN